MALTLVLADDHQILRQGLQAILRTQPDFDVVGEASDGPETVRLVERLLPDVLVLDLRLPALNGLDVTRELVKRCPRTRIVILSMHSDVPYVQEALQAGAIGYVLKDAGVDELMKAIREAAGNRRYLSPALQHELLLAGRPRPEAFPDPYQTLSHREREVLQLTVEGHSGVEIAERLFISPRTVESHRANLMRKLGVRNQKDLVRYAVQRGILAKE